MNLAKDLPRLTPFSITVDGGSDDDDDDNDTFNLQPPSAVSLIPSSSSSHHLATPSALYHSDTSSIDSSTPLAYFEADLDHDPHHDDAERPFLATIHEENRTSTTVPSHRSMNEPQVRGGLARLWSRTTWSKLTALRRYLTVEHAVYVLKTYYAFFAWLIFLWVISAVVLRYRREIFVGLENLAVTVRGMGVGGYLLLAFLIFLSAHPPLVGYGTLLTLAGFTFGFWPGMVVGYAGALAGGITCFTVCRIWFGRYVRRIVEKYPSLEAVVRAVEKKGLKLFVLIRLAPYPYNIMNVLFSATTIPLHTFALGTALSLFKISIHIYIGANLPSFAKHILGDPDADPSKPPAPLTVSDYVRFVAVGAGFVLAMGVMVYVWVQARKVVREAEWERTMEGEGQGERTMAEEWGGWIGGDEEEEGGIALEVGRGRGGKESEEEQEG